MMHHPRRALDFNPVLAGFAYGDLPLITPLARLLLLFQGHEMGTGKLNVYSRWLNVSL